MKSRFLTVREVERLKAAMPRREWLPLQVVCETGLRIGDVLKLKPCDVTGRSVFYIAEKTGKPGAALCSEATAAVLRRGHPGSVWCFPGARSRSKHLTRQAVWARVKRAAKKAGVDLEGCSPHSFRKVFAVDLYTRKGLDAVREALQHSKSDVTRIYALADWSTGENAELPLKRGDLPLILAKIREEVAEMVKECLKADKIC